MSNIFSSPVDGFRQKKSGATGGGKFPHGGTAAGRGGTSSHLHPPPAPSHGANRKSECWANIKQTPDAILMTSNNVMHLFTRLYSHLIPAMVDLEQEESGFAEVETLDSGIRGQSENS